MATWHYRPGRAPFTEFCDWFDLLLIVWFANWFRDHYEVMDNLVEQIFEEYLPGVLLRDQ